MSSHDGGAREPPQTPPSLGPGHDPPDETPLLDEAAVRARLGRARRVVVKIGSKGLTGDAWERLAADVATVRGAGGGPKRSVVLVSSGAIALGVQKLGLKARPQEMAWLQA